MNWLERLLAEGTEADLLRKNNCGYYCPAERRLSASETRLLAKLIFQLTEECHGTTAIVCDREGCPMWKINKET